MGIALFLQAISELPVMFGYTRIRSKTHLSAAALISVSMLCYALKALVLGGASSLGVVMAAGLFQALSFALFTPACVDFMLETVPGSIWPPGTCCSWPSARGPAPWRATPSAASWRSTWAWAGCSAPWACWRCWPAAWRSAVQRC